MFSPCHISGSQHTDRQNSWVFKHQLYVCAASTCWGKGTIKLHQTTVREQLSLNPFPTTGENSFFYFTVFFFFFFTLFYHWHCYGYPYFHSPCAHLCITLNLPPSLCPSPHCCLSPWAVCICSLANPLTFFHPYSPSPLPADSCQSVPCIHASVSILFTSLFCSLDSTYKWDHMVFLFLQLAYFT